MRAALTLALVLVGTPALTHVGGVLDPHGPWPFLALGFAIGMAHALDADHVAAVGALVARGGTNASIVARGAAWGLGHTLALFLICSTVLLLGLTISQRMGAALEFAVGVLIVVLGFRVFWTLWRERIHVHVHEHDGVRHLHAHSHAGEGAHRQSAHAHRHEARALLPTLGVGLVHGAAGSAGLLVLIVASAESTAQALLAFALFGLGSLIGMTLLTAVASYPLAYINRGATWMRTTLAMSVGSLAVVVGSGVMVGSLGALGL